MKKLYMMLWIAIITTTQTFNLVLAQNKTVCPSPLVIRNDIVIKSSQLCVNDCCLSCPFVNNFYEEDKISKTTQAFAGLGIISFFLMFLLAIFFVVLPSQKQNPLSKQILLPFALSVMYFEASEFLTINPKSQCIDSITPTDSSNAYCAAQAIFTLGGGYAIASYSSLLVMHLHLISVWRIEFITKKIIFFHLLIIGASILAIVIPFATRNVQSMNICFVSLSAAPVYYYFLSFIYVAFAAHITTFIHMVHISIKSNQRFSTISTVSKRASIIETQRKLLYIKDIFKVQWRALLGAMTMLSVYVLNWNYYIYKLQSLEGSDLASDWVVKWLRCLNDNGNQNSCARIIEDSVPKYNDIFLLLFFNRTVGLLIFAIFAAKKSIISEVYSLMKRKQPRSRSRDPSFSADQNSPNSVSRLSIKSRNVDDHVSSATESATLFETGPSPRESIISKIESNKELNEVKTQSVKFLTLSPPPPLRKSNSSPSFGGSSDSDPTVRRPLSSVRSLRNLNDLSRNELSRPSVSSIFNDNNTQDVPEIVIVKDNT